MFDKTTELTRLVLVAEHGNILGAAEQLGLSQPALSYTISLLEQRLGAALVERGAPVGAKDGSGSMPLHAAAEWGESSPVVLALVQAHGDAGVALDIRNNAGETAAELILENEDLRDTPAARALNPGDTGGHTE